MTIDVAAALPDGSQFEYGWWLPALTAGEPGADPAAARPAWAALAERAADGAGLMTAGALEAAAAAAARPFADLARGALAECGRSLLPAGHLDADAVAACWAGALSARLSRLARRAVTAEIVQSDGGELTVTALLARYPVLARLLAVTAQSSTAAGHEFLTRLAADRDAVIGRLLAGADPGPAVAVRLDLGEPHCGGRSVLAVAFADGRQVVYKPRSQDAQVLFGEAVTWVAGRVPGSRLRGPAIVARPGYGWAEHVAVESLDGSAAASDFHRDAGILLAVLHATGTTDIHGENVIAAGAAPVVIDAETMLHPELPVLNVTGDDPAAKALASSVLRTAFLPQPTIEEDGAHDRSGLADVSAAGKRAADGAPCEAGGHGAVLLAGFRAGYDVIAADRAAFAALLESGAAEVDSRVVVRPTSGYLALADGALHPSLLREAAAREEALEVLRSASAPHPLWQSLVSYELTDLRDGDIPLFTGRPATRDLWTSAGERLAGRLERSGLASALEKVTGMGELDRVRQEWVITASLATRDQGDGHASVRPARSPVAVAAEPGRLLAAACGIADQVVGLAIEGADDRVNWMGLQLVEDVQWMVLPMGAALGDGYLGVALFLAQLAAVSGISRFSDIARRAVAPLPRLLAALAGRPELAAAIGDGALGGLGGISYGLARLSSLLEDPTLAVHAETAASLAAGAVRESVSGWSHGTAGCLAAMNAVHAQTGSVLAGGLARETAGRLTAEAAAAGGKCGDGGGFSGGAAGIGWALARYAAVTGQERYLAAARLAAGYADSGSGTAGLAGWCSGAAGRLLATACLPDSEEAVTAAIGALDARPALADLSLCHGELGVADVLLAVGQAAGGGAAYQSAVHQSVRRRAGIALDAVTRQCAWCGTPGGVPTPGLAAGLAGVGYGLLRLGFPDLVPSALLLEPQPPATKTSTR